MEEENDFSYDDGIDITLTVQRFEKMLSQKTSLFFDVDEFENLLEYYNSKNRMETQTVFYNFSTSFL
mgnify:CR=1 FL=1